VECVSDLASSDSNEEPDWIASCGWKQTRIGERLRRWQLLVMPGEYHANETRPASLEEETRTVIEEARMVLPGIQAVFGFQLIAVFSNGFHSLTPPERLMHLIALILIMIAIALIMTPASYHRIAEKGTVSRRFVEIASRLLALAMFPLMLGMTADLFLVARLILNNVALSLAIAAALVCVFFGLWYLFPWIERRFIRGGSNTMREE
jgi:hypothetical protein